MKGVKKIVDTSKLSFFKQIILDSDVVVYDLNSCDYEECEFAIKSMNYLNEALQMGEYLETKFLICISSVMVWSNTPPKEKKSRLILIKGEEEEDEPEEPDSEGEEE